MSLAQAKKEYNSFKKNNPMLSKNSTDYVKKRLSTSSLLENGRIK